MYSEVRNTLSKSERIYLKNEISRLFHEGKGLISYPIRFVYLQLPIAERKSEVAVPLSMMVMAPKKRFKRANKRNRCKRLLREVFRVRKQRLIELHKNNGKSLLLACIIVSNDMPDFLVIDRAMEKGLNQIYQALNGKIEKKE